MSPVTRHMSPVTCHMSHDMCHMSFFFKDKVVKLIGEGSVINGGPTPSSFCLEPFPWSVFFLYFSEEGEGVVGRLIGQSPILPWKGLGVSSGQS